MNWKGHVAAILMFVFIFFAVTLDVMRKDKLKKSEVYEKTTRKNYFIENKETNIEKMRNELKATYNSYARELSDRGRMYTGYTACKKYNPKDIELCNIIFEVINEQQNFKQLLE